MTKESNDYFEILSSDITFSSAIKEMKLSEERINEIKDSGILALSAKDYYGRKGNSFFGGAREFYMYCQEKGLGKNIDFCIEKSQYLEIDLNSIELFLGTFLISSIMIPIFVNLISDFIKTKLMRDDDKITINIIINNNVQNNSTLINFSGTKKDFEHKVIKTLTTYNKDGYLLIQNQTGDNLDVLY